MGELLPCPFCGGKGETVNEEDDIGDNYMTGCRNCGVWFETEDQWNRRVTETKESEGA